MNMTLDLDGLVQKLSMLPHVHASVMEDVSPYVLTHILKPLKENGTVSFCDLDFDAFCDEDLEELLQALSEEESIAENIKRLMQTLCAARPKASSKQLFC